MAQEKRKSNGTNGSNGTTSSSDVATSILDLQALLRTTMGDGLIVDSYTAKNFLPPGENYGSLILQVDAVVRRKGANSEPEDLHMIAKVPPLTQQQRDFFDSPFTFGKESFMYDTILPTYMKFERDECGIRDVFDIGPAFYGSRMNLEFGDVFDDHAIILMDNLKSRGYYCGSRYTGLDIHHSRIAIAALAKFHALGIAMKTKKPDFFEVLKVRSKCLTFKDPDGWDEISAQMERCIKEDPEMTKHYESCVKAMKAGHGPGTWLNVPEEPWSTIIHSDFWINNIMFHRDETTGMPDDVKFIDFQNYLFLSPLRELCFALGSIVDPDVSANHLPDLLDLYHKTLISRLETMECDVSPYSREKFDERLPVDAILEFNHSAFMLKITTKAVDVNDPESRNVLNAMMGGGSKQFYVRMRNLVAAYAKLGWF